MRRVLSSRFLRRQVFAVMAWVAAALPVGAWAQSLPGAEALEVLVKSSLLTFNDANVTGNYTVFHARVAKPFRDQFTPDQLAAAFESFRKQKIDIDAISVLDPVWTEEARIDNRGALLVRGYFETSPNRVTFVLDYAPSEGQWKLINIHVKVKPPGE